MYLIKSLGSSHIITTFVTGLSLGKNRGLHNFIKGDYNLDINSKMYPIKINEEEKKTKVEERLSKSTYHDSLNYGQD